MLKHRWVLGPLLLAFFSMAFVWGYTVDDALITARYAHHLARGLGYVWNPGGPSTDGVTPLPMPFVLAPFAKDGPLAALHAARALGVASALASAAILAQCMQRMEGPWSVRSLCFLSVVLSLPWAAYAVSGMETPVATLLVTAALASHGRPARASMLVGLATTFRPELLPFAVILAAGAAVVRRASHAEVLACLSLALLPFVAVALIRTAVWGAPAPLALAAKPSDLAHGVAYLAGSLPMVGAFVAGLSPSALLRERGIGLVALLAAWVHLGVVALVGGDWMSYGRLLVPVIPALGYGAARLALHADRRFALARGLVATGLSLTFLLAVGGKGRGVYDDRVRLIEQARPLLAAAKRVATLDIGWVGAAFSGDIFDLAGLTDPHIAALSGGHTSKRVSGAMLAERAPDFFFYLVRALPESSVPPEELAPARIVEARLARESWVREHYRVRSVLWTRSGWAVIAMEKSPTP